MLFLNITFICLFFIFTDLVPIYQNRQWQLFWIYTAMMVLICVLSMLISLDINIPSPAVPLKRMISVVLDF